jgi:hypothetical protein
MSFVQSFPPPPNYFKNYKEETAALPPPPPINGDYKVFGEVIQVIPFKIKKIIQSKEILRRPSDDNVKELFPEKFGNSFTF